MKFRVETWDTTEKCGDWVCVLETGEADLARVDFAWWVKFSEHEIADKSDAKVGDNVWDAVLDMAEGRESEIKRLHIRIGELAGPNKEATRRAPRGRRQGLEHAPYRREVGRAPVNQIETSADATFCVGDFDNPSELAHALEQMDHDGYMLVSMVTAAIGINTPPHMLATRVVWAKRPRAPLPRGVN